MIPVISHRLDAIFDWFIVCVVLASVAMLIWNLGRGWMW